jgi:ferrochelatase
MPEGSDVATEDRPGVLLVSLGAPESLDEVPGFLTALRGGRPTPPEMVVEFVERYRSIGGGSPLNRICRETARRVERQIRSRGMSLACRYGAIHGNPSATEAYEDLLDEGITRGICVPLTPFYTSWGVGQYLSRVRSICRSRAPHLPMEYLTGWHSAPGLSRAWSRRIHSVLPSLSARFGEPPHLIFSAHSLPFRAGALPLDYIGQLSELRAQILEQLPPLGWEMAYQSVGRAEGPWLRPRVEEVVGDLLDRTTAPLLLVPLGFVADNLEILYDLDQALRARYASQAGRIVRVPSPNADDDLVDTLVSVVGTMGPDTGPGEPSHHGSSGSPSLLSTSLDSRGGCPRASRRRPSSQICARTVSPPSRPP